jgi:uncharacterized protein (TIGR02391 family)
MREIPGGRQVVLIKHFGSSDEERHIVTGNIQSKAGFFGLDVPIEPGDVVEEPDPRPGFAVIRRTVGKVDIHQGHRALNHIEVTWGEPPRERARPVSLQIGDLHPRIGNLSGALYANGHYAPAVFEAFKGVENRVRELSGTDLSGPKLIGQAFGGTSPRFRLSGREGRSGQDEHEGRTLMLMGALQAIRNPGAHGSDALDQGSARELLATRAS